MFIELPDSKYNEGIEIEEYNGVWSMVLAQRADDGKTYKRWCFPQVKDKKPSGKAIPWKITLGGSVQEAIDTLHAMEKALLNDGKPDLGQYDQSGADDDIAF